MQNRKYLRSKVFGSVFGACIGDALGLPCECSSPESIKKNFGYVDKYVSNHYHPFQHVAKQSPGTISDDSQLTLAMMHALKKGYDIKKIISSHILASDQKWGEPVGWGKSTREACVKMKRGEAETLSPNGAGNGACMKIAPLSIYSVYRTTFRSDEQKFTDVFNKSLFNKCKEITRLTHGNPMCITATYCQARMVIRAIQDEIPLATEEIAKLFIKDAIYAEELNQTKCDLYLSNRLNEILSSVNFNTETSEISKIITNKESSFVYNSYPMVAYCFSKYAPYKNFRLAVTSTINAGADADSNGSMVGALIGGYLGVLSIPKDWISNLLEQEMILREINSFENNISC